MRVFLADDDVAVCSALRLLLEQDGTMEVVGEASESADLLQQVATAAPDLVLLDWELPGSRSADLVPALQSSCPGLVIIALSCRPQARAAAIAAGADEFVSKGDPPESLLGALKSPRLRSVCRNPG